MVLVQILKSATTVWVEAAMMCVKNEGGQSPRMKPELYTIVT